MSKRNYMMRYTHIINRLRRGGADFEEILAYLERQEQIEGIPLSISKRTFQRDLKEISTLYGIEIVHNAIKRVYEINEEGSYPQNERILEAFDTLNLLSMKENLSNYLYFEQRRPKGTNHFYGIIHAIKNRLSLTFEYYHYWDDKVTSRLVNPLAIKESQGRWYLIVQDVNDGLKIKTFGMDRMSDMDITKQKFDYPRDFDIQQYFSFSFGVLTDDQLPIEEVVLSFDPKQARYIKSLPLHHSQRVILDNEQEVQIALQIQVTEDFIMEVLSYGNTVKVIQSTTLIDELRWRTQTMASYYNP